MANPKPVCKFPAVFPGEDGKAVATKTVRVPVYLEQEIKEYVRRLHKERMGT